MRVYSKIFYLDFRLCFAHNIKVKAFERVRGSSRLGEDPIQVTYRIYNQRYWTPVLDYERGNL